MYDQCMINMQYDGNSTNYDDDFKVSSKLLASCHSKLYREDIKSINNEDSVAAILVAMHT